MGNRTQERHFHITTSQCFPEEFPIFSLNLRPPAFPLKPTDESHIHPHHKWELESRLRDSSVSCLACMTYGLELHQGKKKEEEEETENDLGWPPLIHCTPEQQPAPAPHHWWRLSGEPIQATSMPRGKYTVTFSDITLRQTLIYAVGLHLHPPEPDCIFYC